MDIPDYWPEGATPVELAPGLWTPRVAEMATDSLGYEPLKGLRLHFRARLNDSFRYAMELLTVESLGEVEITGGMLRKLPVASIMEVYLGFLPSLHLGVGRWRSFQTLKTAGDESWHYLTGDNLVDVARIYAYEEAVGGTPAATVAHLLDLPRSTADSWIRRAKDKGLIYAEA